jgi:hypothetical protein
MQPSCRNAESTTRPPVGVNFVADPLAPIGAI